jgi:hypothetical protein
MFLVRLGVARQDNRAPISVVGRWTSIIWMVLISLIQRAESGPEPVCGVGGAKSHASSKR